MRMPSQNPIPAPNMTTPRIVRIIGAGMAGCEAAWQLAERGIKVELYEMKPKRFSPAHKLPGFAELVCSNSFGSTKPATGSGILKQEMQALGSFILRHGLAHAVPAGMALAIERVGFSEAVTQQLRSHANITVINEEVDSIDTDIPTIVATGPLTSDKLAAAIGKLVGDKFMFFYDAISPIIAADSLDMSKLFFASRYAAQQIVDGEIKEEDYLNIPLSKEQYYTLIDDLKAAEKVPLHDFENPNYFEACLPMDVLAARGVETLAHGALKPVGLVNPHSSERPYAVIQLRRENLPTTMYSMVGCQNKLKWPEQEKVFRKLPGLENAKFVRLGSVHRNTYIHAPSLLNSDLSLRQYPNVYMAGQISGVEGYMESAAIGMMSGIYCAHRLLGNPLSPLPRTSIIGALIHYLCNGAPNSDSFQPMNCNFSLLPTNTEQPKIRSRQARRENKGASAQEALASWMQTSQLSPL